MKRKTKKNLRVDYSSKDFQDFVTESKNQLFIEMANYGTQTLPSFKKTWHMIEEGLEEDDRYINVLVSFISFSLSVVLLNNNKKQRDKYIWSLWYYLKLDEPLLKSRFKAESEKLVQEIDSMILQILKDEYPIYLKWLHEHK